MRLWVHPSSRWRPNVSLVVFFQNDWLYSWGWKWLCFRLKKGRKEISGENFVWRTRDSRSEEDHSLQVLSKVETLGAWPSIRRCCWNGKAAGGYSRKPIRLVFFFFAGHWRRISWMNFDSIRENADISLTAGHRRKRSKVHWTRHLIRIKKKIKKPLNIYIYYIILIGFQNFVFSCFFLISSY